MTEEACCWGWPVHVMSEVVNPNEWKLCDYAVESRHIAWLMSVSRDLMA